MITFSIIQKSQLEGAHRMDAEYFQPEYAVLEQSIIKTKTYIKWGDIKGKFITGPFGSEFNVENYIENGKYRYIRGKDVKALFLTDDDNEYIPEEDFKRLNKYSLREGDILISVVGTNGNSAIVNAKALPAIFSSKSSVFRPSNIDPYYLITYLSSKYGKGLLLRNVRGQVQTGLNIEDLKRLLIFIPSEKYQQSVASLLTESFNNLEESKEYYQQAEDLLLEELGLRDFQAEDDLSFVVNLSDVTSANRVDAEYFQPKYEKLIEKIKSQNTKPLLEIVKNAAARFSPKSDDNYSYVELANINSSIGLIDGTDEVLGKDAPSRAKRILKTGDVIISSVEGSLQKVAVVKNEQDGYLASTGFFQLRSEEILPEVLLILAKSIVLQMQMEKHCAGTILTAVPNEALEKMVIPLMDQPTQQKIAELVKKSHEARKKSKELLEEAKRKVEEMIENGGN